MRLSVLFPTFSSINSFDKVMANRVRPCYLSLCAHISHSPSNSVNERFDLLSKSVCNFHRNLRYINISYCA